MFLNMFSMFDPTVKFMLPLNYTIPIIILMINYKFWTSKFKMQIIKIIHQTKTNKSMMKMVNPIFISVLIINMMNLVPTMFSSTPNITFILNLTLLMWVIMIMISMINDFNILFMNMTPKSTSLNMISMINLIEINSLMFSILSLSMRMMINMMMGHLIINMMNYLPTISIYLMIEMMIILIQTYIYITLNTINFNNIM